MYFLLFVFMVWRQVFWFDSCWTFSAAITYVPFILLTLVVVYLYSSILFFDLIWRPLVEPDQDFYSVSWLKAFVTLAPISAGISLFLAIMSARSHLMEVQHKKAVLKHDRALQVILLPAVFAVMCVSGIVPYLQLTTGTLIPQMTNSFWWKYERDVNVPTYQEASAYAAWKYNSCMYVADLFEAWVLFQFGALILEVVGEAIEAADNQCGCTRKHELAEAHGAVSSLSWVGLSMFIGICIMEALFSVFPYLGGSQGTQSTIMSHLGVAGFFGSSVALYDLYVVETSFHHKLSPLSPILKFMSVKLLVTLSYIQICVLQGAHIVFQFSPEWVKATCAHIPYIGGILILDANQVNVFYPAMVAHECFFLSLMHVFVWRASEKWYTSDRKSIADFADPEADMKHLSETTPLVERGESTGAAGAQGSTASMMDRVRNSLKNW